MRVLLCLCVSSESCLLSGTSNARQDLGHILDFVTRLKHLKVASLASCLIVSKGYLRMSMSNIRQLLSLG